MQEVIGQSMLLSRHKLQPFLNEGFNYKDRRTNAGKSTADPDELGRRKQVYIRFRHRVEKYRRKLEAVLKDKDVFKIEELLTEINTMDDDSELHHHLRLEIIKAQLCMQAYYRWRQEMRDFTSQNAKDVLRHIMEKQKRKEEEKK
mmetsp:Transcript_11502/g.17311  ORF Transcript_11502/g.17311 Transcript_11502/m.17311 type:complete len:145 (+) Transcript_11502:1104-1538(+)|eukprot:CAMPEP_0170499264 /NCGR_PEP_ID=MMETSP0208-20121228/30781_1 /TAXON_ID=197538 /ORGANISM="Strombidium inclinatum, Strain S3" /LENGTH=144 /DNA_ID=CAMNT_0010776755 /DNA_START=1025 /DNA_END=1459 /DNA_ORIENTATION=+